MNTPPEVIKIERVDDIPLLLAQMQKMEVATLLDKHYPMHGNWQGLSLGQVVEVWLSFILSEGDHRLNSVRTWVKGLLLSLRVCLGIANVRELDFDDDRLCCVLDYLGKDDAAWEAYECEQNATLLRVYDLSPQRIRIDSTTAKSYVGVSEGGLFQFGHSKEHRPDLPQLKINQSTLDPLGLPLSTSIVGGQCADDPLYIPEIRKVQACLAQRGLLYVGDCKMASIDARAYLAASHDHYLCPLSAVQMPAAILRDLLAPVFAGTQLLSAVQRAPEANPDKPEHIADGFAYSVTLQSADTQWQEQRFVVKSLKHAKAKHAALDERLKNAEQDILTLNVQGRGRKRLDEAQTRTAAQAIVKRCAVAELLQIEYAVTSKTTRKRAHLDKPAHDITTVSVKVSTTRNQAAYEDAVRCLGWRVFVCNDPQMCLEEAVLAYREEYIIERGFNRLRGKLLGITPLYLSSTTRIKGLIRLLSIALRVLCLVEFTVRRALKEKQGTLAGIYVGNPKRASARPTTEMMLHAFKGINHVVVGNDQTHWHSTTPLNTVQTRILDLLGLPTSIYQTLIQQSGDVALQMSEP